MESCVLIAKHAGRQGGERVILRGKGISVHESGYKIRNANPISIMDSRLRILY